MSEVEAETRKLTTKELVGGVLPPVVMDTGLAHALGKGKASQRPHRVKAFLSHFKVMGDVDPGCNLLWQSAAPTPITDDVLSRLEEAARAETNDDDAWQPEAWANVAEAALGGVPWKISGRDSRDFKKVRQSAQVEASWRRETHANLAFADLEDVSLRTVRNLFRKHWPNSPWTMHSCSSIRSFDGLGISRAVAGPRCCRRPVHRGSVPTLAQSASVPLRWPGEVALLALLTLSVHSAAYRGDGKPLFGPRTATRARRTPRRPSPHILWHWVLRSGDTWRTARTAQRLSESPGAASRSRRGAYGRVPHFQEVRAGRDRPQGHHEANWRRAGQVRESGRSKSRIGTLGALEGLSSPDRRRSSAAATGATTASHSDEG